MSPRTRSPVSWIAVDWGTSNLRVWVIGHDGAILAQRNSNEGMSRLSSDEYEPALLELISDFLPKDSSTNIPLTIGICGMAGAREGWIDAGYLSTPCPPPRARDAVMVPTDDPRISVKILPGVKQTSPPDVMRGEETQIAGILAAMPAGNGTICLPGTHTKWVKIDDGKIINFQTFMTGEIFSLLSKSSVLRHVVSPSGWDDTAFANAITQSVEHPNMPTAQLFSLRADALLNQRSEDEARAKLSGHLIGVELQATRTLWQGQKVMVCGDKTVAQAYRNALQILGAEVEALDAATLTLAGLKTAFEKQ